MPRQIHFLQPRLLSGVIKTTPPSKPHICAVASRFDAMVAYVSLHSTPPAHDSTTRRHRRPTVSSKTRCPRAHVRAPRPSSAPRRRSVKKRHSTLGERIARASSPPPRTHALTAAPIEDAVLARGIDRVELDPRARQSEDGPARHTDPRGGRRVAAIGAAQEYSGTERAPPYRHGTGPLLRSDQELTERILVPR